MKSSLFAVFFIVWAITSYASYSFFTIRNAYNQIVVVPNATPVQTAQATPTPTPDPLAPYGILLLGYRGDGSIGGTLTDTMMVAHIAPRAQKVTLISIPRDLWVPLATDGKVERNYKINAAYAIGMDDRNYPNKADKYKGVAGGGVMAKDIVSLVTGINVRYFVAVNFHAFTQSIDTLGGVDVRVSKQLNDTFYPITGKENETCGKSEDELKALEATLSGQPLEEQFTCRFETVKVDPGIVHMDGEMALKFARSRHAKSDGSDFARSERQKEVMLAAKEKVYSIGFLPKAIPFVQTLAGSLQTDMNISVMQDFLSKSSEYRQFKVTSLSLSTNNVLKETYSNDRQYILAPTSGIGDWTSIIDYLHDQLSVDASPSPTVKP